MKFTPSAANKGCCQGRADRAPTGISTRPSTAQRPTKPDCCGNRAKATTAAPTAATAVPIVKDLALE